VFDAGCWMLDAGCWMLDAGCWMLDADYRERCKVQFKSQSLVVSYSLSTVIYQLSSQHQVSSIQHPVNYHLPASGI
jgi:hypothetical protein